MNTDTDGIEKDCDYEEADGICLILRSRPCLVVIVNVDVIVIVMMRKLMVSKESV